MVKFVSDKILLNIERRLMYYCSELQMRVLVQEIAFVRSKSTNFPKI